MSTPQSQQELRNNRELFRFIWDASEAHGDTRADEEAWRNELWLLIEKAVTAHDKKLLAEVRERVIGPDKEITLDDVYGNDPRNNYGHHEIEVVRERNTANRKLRAEQRKKLEELL